MRLIVFHYHLLPGGVTQVIKSSAIAALKYLPEIDSITLVSGKKDNSGNVAAEIRKNLDGNISDKSDILSVSLPELDYMSDMEKLPNTESLIKILKKRFAGHLWWIHNYHLGKNPVFTEAVLQIAEELPEQKMILQIHDFPEASRYKNLEVLHKYVTHPLYPIFSNIRYVTINDRDSTYLIAAGIPKEMVFLLNNPVEAFQEKENTRENYKKIDKVLSGSVPSYIERAPLIIYPVRTIRRKNILEAGLLAKCSTTPVNLLPTLPGVSTAEKGYSEIIDTCFDEQLIPGAAQAGIVLASKGITFPNIMSAGRIIISSSVQEGFGYLFINSLQWRKPLLARKLDVIRDFSDMFSTEFSHFYKNVEIPLSTTLRKQLKYEYSRKISTLGKFLDKEIISNLKKQETLVIQENSIDFSYLSPMMQRKFLKDLEDPGLFEETRKMNANILEQMNIMLAMDTIPFKEKVIEKFSLTNHAEQIGNIISSLKNDIQNTSSPKKNINYSMVASFADFASISLLYDPI